MHYQLTNLIAGRLIRSSVAGAELKRNRMKNHCRHTLQLCYFLGSLLLPTALINARIWFCRSADLGQWAFPNPSMKLIFKREVCASLFLWGLPYISSPPFFSPFAEPWILKGWFSQHGGMGTDYKAQHKARKGALLNVEEHLGATLVEHRQPWSASGSYFQTECYKWTVLLHLVYFWWTGNNMNK